MMGLKGKGGFNQDDYEQTTKRKTYIDKKEYNIEEIKRRLKTYKLSGLNNHIYEKLAYTWVDGTYFVRKHIFVPIKDNQSNFIRDIVIGKQEGTVEEIYKKYDSYSIIKDDCSKDIFYMLCNGYHICMLLMITVVLVYVLIKKKQDYILLLCIMMFGITFMLLIWETRSRYLFNFTPIMILIASKALSLNYKYILKKVYTENICVIKNRLKELIQNYKIFQN